MTVNDIMNLASIRPVSVEPDRDFDKIFCCDLLSVAMARAPENSAWVTVVGNVNTIAVASLCDVSCIIIAEGYSFDKEAINAAQGKVTLLSSELPTYETSIQIGGLLK